MFVYFSLLLLLAFIGESLIWFHSLFYFFVAILYIFSQWKYKNISLRLNFLIPLALLNVWVFISVFFSVHLGKSIFSALDFLTYSLIFVSLLKMRIHPWKLANFVLILAALLGIYGLAQFILTDFWNYVRAYSAFSLHNYFAGFLIFAMPIAVFKIIEEERASRKVTAHWPSPAGVIPAKAGIPSLENYTLGFPIAPRLHRGLSGMTLIPSEQLRRKTWPLWALVALLLVNLYFTFSRWAFISLGLVMVLLIILHYKDIGSWLKWGSVIGIAALSIAGLTALKIWHAGVNGVDLDMFLRRVYVEQSSPQPLAPQSLELQSPEPYGSGQSIPLDTMALQSVEPRNAYRFRLQYWRNTLRLAGDYFWLGVGIGGYGDAYKKYVNDVRDFAANPHNILLWILAELGFIGFILFSVFFIRWGVFGMIGFKGFSLAKLSIVYGVLALLIHNLADYSLASPVNALILALGFSVLVGSSVVQEKTRFNSWIPSIVLGGSLIVAGLLANVYTSEYFFKSAKDYRAVYHDDQRFLSAMNAALKLDATNYIYRDYLARFYIEKGEGAKRQYEKALLDNPIGIPMLDFYFLKLLFEEGDFEGVIRHSSRILPYYPLAVMDSPRWLTVTETQDRKQAIAKIYQLRGLSYARLGDQQNSGISLRTAKEYDIK
ncbi:MAG: O-antigen ligase family protein [Parcubacteria group bacterium]|nr:O-antigen ligase family protein [Parcubacteria group bacterium]